MVYSLCEADCNIVLAHRIYNRKFPDVSAAFENLKDIGGVTYKKKAVMAQDADKFYETMDND